MGLVFVMVYGAGIAAVFIVPMISAPETEFSGRVSREFSIALIPLDIDDSDHPLGFTTLERLNARKVNLEAYTFLLPSPRVLINVGDFHTAEILEEDGNSQLVSFHYSNTRTSTSIYRAFRDHIEPVNHKVTSHAGQVFSAMLLVIPSLILAAIISLSYNWISKRRALEYKGDST